MGVFFSSTSSVAEDLEEKLMNEYIECMSQASLYKSMNKPELASKFERLALQAENIHTSVKTTLHHDNIVELQRETNKFMDSKVNIDLNFVNRTEGTYIKSELKEELIEALPTFTLESNNTPIISLPEAPRGPPVQKKRDLLA